MKKPPRVARRLVTDLSLRSVDVVQELLKLIHLFHTCFDIPSAPGPQDPEANQKNKEPPKCTHRPIRLTIKRGDTCQRGRKGWFEFDVLNCHFVSPWLSCELVSEFLLVLRVHHSEVLMLLFSNVPRVHQHKLREVHCTVIGPHMHSELVEHLHRVQTGDHRDYGILLPNEPVHLHGFS